MANVDLITKKIYGAEKGTETFYHEYAHLIFEDKCKIGNEIRVGQDLSFRWLVFIIAFALLLGSNIFMKGLIIIWILISIFFEMYEEIWCWKYAKKTLREKERVERRKAIKVSKV
jgi:hypothetical protein